MVAETSALQRGFLLRQKDRKVGDDNKIQSKSSLEIKSGFLLKKKPIAKDIATSRQATSTPSKNHPFSNKTANSDCGFAKGFLVSKTRSKSQKKPQIKVSKQHNEASKDLMNLEYPSAAQTTSSLFVLEKETSKPINPQKPLISVLDHDGSTPTRHAPLSLPSRPLISIVGDDDHKANLPCDGDEMNDDGILFQERTTTFYPSRRQMVVGEPLMMEVTTPMKSMPQSNSKRILMSTLNNSSGSTPSNGSIATSFFKFQQELAKLKWKETETTNIDFIVSSWSHTQASWAWQYLFSLKRTTHQSLIDSILHHHPATVRDWLVSETPQDRTQALQLIQWIQEYLIRPEHLFRSRADAATDPLCADTWLDTVLPSLSALIDQRRTVLAQEGWTTCMVLLSRCTCRASAPSMDILDRLLNIQIVWKQAKKKSPKNQAQITLLQDWIQTNQSSSEKSTHWQKQVSGIPLDDCLGFGGLVHLFCSDAMSSRGLIFKDLSKPWKLLCEMAEHSNNSSILWRGILAHLSTLKQLESETQTDIVENVMTMLSKIKKRSDCILAISILTLAWSDSDGFPQDLYSHSGPGLPRSIEYLLVALSDSAYEMESIEIESPLEPLLSFVEKCALHAPDSVKIVDDILTNHGMKRYTVRIFSNLLQYQKKLSGSIATEKAAVLLEDTTLRKHIQDIMVEYIPKSSFVRAWFLSSGHALIDAFDGQTLRQVIPKLLGILNEHFVRNNVFSSDTVATISSIMTTILLGCAENGTLRALVSEVALVLRDARLLSKDIATDSSLGAFCSNFCDKWRILLLESQNISNVAFADLLSATADEITLYSSSVATLSFFGALVGDDNPVELASNQSTRLRIMLAVERLLSFCGGKMKQHQEQGADSILTRLSPLLILRRIPAAYFTVARIESRKTSESNQIERVYRQIAIPVASILEVPGAISRINELTPEERGLAAEVAGRSFPFGKPVTSNPRSLQENPSFSAFERFCSPTFTELIREVRNGGLKSSSIPLIRSARLALYSVYHSMIDGKLKDEESWEQEYCKTASFALCAIGIEFDGFDDNLSCEVIQLQTGCIEFFAICLAQSLEKEHDSPASPCCHSLSPSHIGLHQTLNKCPCGPMDRISQAVMTILKAEYVDPEIEWICCAESHFLNLTSHVARNPSAQARTCLWNALILVAQRSSEKDGSLSNIAKVTMPWIAEWGDSNISSETNDRNPACIAAAMQIGFIILTRSKSLVCLKGCNHSKDFAGMLYRWALHGINDKGSTKVKNYSDRTTRMAALKLLMALITLGGIETEKNSYLKIEQMMESVDALQRLSILDSDPDIRGLSSRILTILAIPQDV